MLDLYFKKEKSNDYEQLNVDYTSKRKGKAGVRVKEFLIRGLVSDTTYHTPVNRGKNLESFDRGGKLLKGGVGCSVHGSEI